MIINGNECSTNLKGYWVYFGYSKKGKLLYIGTTMQKPSDRFRWHRHNGKDLKFKVVASFNCADEMLKKEVELISKHNPQMNKKKSKHNDNRKLNEKDIASRKGDKQWCQCCLKRRVSAGYRKCMWCS